MFLLLTQVLVGCGGSNPEVFATCEVDLALEPSQGFPGDEVVASGGPFSERYDTVVAIDGVSADIVDIDRVDCSTCDTCRFNNGCATCGRCFACEDACASCEQSLTFTVPEVDAGVRVVNVRNRHGESPFVEFLVLGNTGTADTQATSNTGDTASTGHTADSASHTADSAPTNDTASTAETSSTGATAATGDTAQTAVTGHTASTADTVSTGDTSSTAQTGSITGDTVGPTADTAETGDTQ